MSKGFSSIKSSVAKIRDFSNQLRAIHFERDDVIQGLSVALIARVPVILDGPPGTGKSKLVGAYADLIKGQKWIQWLRPDTTTAEIFGAPIYDELLKGNIKFNVKGKITDAHVVIVEEVFRGGAVLNSLLSIMNERKFVNHDEILEAAWRLFVGTTNFLPRDEILHAVQDRFVLRYKVPKIVDSSNFGKLWSADSVDDPKPKETLSIAELDAIYEFLPNVEISDEIAAKVQAIRNKMENQGLNSASDRRWRQGRPVLQAAALLEGRDAVEPVDLMILPYVLWSRRDGSDLPQIQEIVSEEIDAGTAQLMGLKKSADDIRQKWESRVNQSFDRHEVVQEAVTDMMALSDYLRKAERELKSVSKAQLPRMKAIVKEIERTARWVKQISEEFAAGDNTVIFDIKTIVK